MSEQGRNAAATHWVFGYGSLIWKPGFAHVSAVPGRVYGVHRALCIYSHIYRGTPDLPGLVFGLMRGGSCAGMGFEVTEDAWPGVVAYLREREQVTSVYVETMRTLRLADGREVKALMYVTDEAHEQFAGRLSPEVQIGMVRAAAGQAGPNLDYVLNTATHLDNLALADASLTLLARRLKSAVEI